MTSKIWTSNTQEYPPHLAPLPRLKFHGCRLHNVYRKCDSGGSTPNRSSSSKLNRIHILGGEKRTGFRFYGAFSIRCLARTLGLQFDSGQLARHLVTCYKYWSWLLGMVCLIMGLCLWLWADIFPSWGDGGDGNSLCHSNRLLRLPGL